LASQRPEFAELMATKMHLVYADGMGVVWAARQCGAQVQERINAADFITDFLVQCQGRGLKIFLMGGKEGVASGAARTWQQQVPGLAIVGTQSGYMDDPTMAASAVRDSGADLLILGMGSPTQEEWASVHGRNTGVKVIWCVGAMMEYHSGMTARAPVWMRRAGLEWLFRLAVEPGRLWRRYLIGNLEFLWITIRKRPLFQANSLPRD
jgi:N-acetylglucosaminyldiphosphoundecaprenol N-acetyl-beta-D-mannosaminyltransferase